jgi:protoporphyrinogen IX oxidase
MNWLGGAYFWIKSAHLIFVIFWMAGLFMLPRFFVYHQECDVGSAEDGKWVDRETRLIRIILNPAMAVVWIMGLMLAVDGGAFATHWFHAKLLVVAGLSGYHFWLIKYAGKLAIGERPWDDRTLRLINEVPGIAAAAIVVLVVVKPF